MLETNKQTLLFNFGEDLSYFVILPYKLRDLIKIYDDFVNKGAVINYAREGAGREIQNFAKNFIAPVRFQFLFHSPFEKLYLVSWPICAAYAFFGTCTCKSL